MATHCLVCVYHWVGRAELCAYTFFLRHFQPCLSYLTWPFESRSLFFKPLPLPACILHRSAPPLVFWQDNFNYFSHLSLHFCTPPSLFNWTANLFVLCFFILFFFGKPLLQLHSFSLSFYISVLSFVSLTFSLFLSLSAFCLSCSISFTQNGLFKRQIIQVTKWKSQNYCQINKRGIFWLIKWHGHISVY